jgi:hypothetical protein
MSGCGARTAAGSLEAVFDSSDVELPSRVELVDSLGSLGGRLRYSAVPSLPRRVRSPSCGYCRASLSPFRRAADRFDCRQRPVPHLVDDLPPRVPQRSDQGRLQIARDQPPKSHGLQTGARERGLHLGFAPFVQVPRHRGPGDSGLTLGAASGGQPSSPTMSTSVRFVTPSRGLPPWVRTSAKDRPASGAEQN